MKNSDLSMEKTKFLKNLKLEELTVYKMKLAESVELTQKELEKFNYSNNSLEQNSTLKISINLIKTSLKLAKEYESLLMSKSNGNYYNWINYEPKLAKNLANIIFSKDKLQKFGNLIAKELDHFCISPNAKKVACQNTINKREIRNIASNLNPKII